MAALCNRDYKRGYNVLAGGGNTISFSVNGRGHDVTEKMNMCASFGYIEVEDVRLEAHWTKTTKVYSDGSKSDAGDSAVNFTGTVTMRCPYSKDEYNELWQDDIDYNKYESKAEDCKENLEFAEAEKKGKLVHRGPTVVNIVFLIITGVISALFLTLFFVGINAWKAGFGLPNDYANHSFNLPFGDPSFERSIFQSVFTFGFCFAFLICFIMLFVNLHKDKVVQNKKFAQLHEKNLDANTLRNSMEENQSDMNKIFRNMPYWQKHSVKYEFDYFKTVSGIYDKTLSVRRVEDAVTVI